MNWIGILTILLSIGITVSTFSLNYAINYWLKISGFDFLNREIQYLNCVALLISIIILLSSYFVIYKCTNLVTFLITYSICCFGLVEFYYGLFLFMDSQGYISTMYGPWEKAVNTPQLHEIEKRFGCCSFHRFAQFPNDECNWSIVTCQQSMSIHLEELTQSIGKTLIFHAIVHALIGILLGYAAQKRKKKRTYNAGEWQNEIIDSNYIVPKYR